MLSVSDVPTNLPTDGQSEPSKQFCCFIITYFKDLKIEPCLALRMQRIRLHHTAHLASDAEGWMSGSQLPSQYYGTLLIKTEKIRKISNLFELTNG